MIDIQDFLEKVGTLQEQGRRFPCPRCGEIKMDTDPTQNALSRYVDAYICDDCGMEEALDSVYGKAENLNKWSIVEVLKKRRGEVNG